MRYKSYLFILLLYVFSCKNEKDLTNNELELVFLNDSLISYVSKDNIPHEEAFHKEEYKNLSNNIITFRIHNKGENSYVLFFDNSKLTNCPNDFMSIGFENLVFKDENDNSPIYYNTSVNGEELYYDFLDYQDEIVRTYYNNIGYKNKSNSWKDKSADITRSLLTIHPNETIYFKSYTSLPQKKDVLNGNYTGVKFQLEKKYTAKIKFNFLKYSEVEGFLTDLKKKEINENLYKVYEGVLESINSVPLKFIEK